MCECWVLTLSRKQSFTHALRCVHIPGALALGMPFTTSTAAQALEELRKKPSGWWGVLLTPLVTQTREYHTIHNLSNMPVTFPPEDCLS